MKTKAKFLVLLLVSMHFLQSCDDDSYEEENDIGRKIVVEGFVFADEVVENLRLSKIHSNGQVESVPVMDAEVEITQNGNVMNLVHDSQFAGNYSQVDTSWLIQPSGIVNLKITHGNHAYSAQAAVPPKIENLVASATEIIVDPSNEDEVVLTLTWEPVETNGYCIFVRNISDDSYPQNPVFGTSAENPFVIINESHTVELRGAHFSHYGTYEIYVSAANQEYINTYALGENADLEIAPSNIENGWGVFTVFNGASISLVVE